MARSLPETDVQYLRDLRDAREMGRIDEMVNPNHVPLKPDVSFSEAGRLFGEGIVQRWIDEGLIKYRQDGPRCKKRLSRVELEELNRASNRASFMTVAERKELNKRK